MAAIKPDPRLAAFLDLIAWSEGTSTHPLTRAAGYDVIVSGIDGAHIFADFSAHPFATGRSPIVLRRCLYKGLRGDTEDPTAAVVPIEVVTPALRSTASGRYQLILPTWLEMQRKIKLPTFSPPFQDAAAMELIDEAHGTERLLANDAAGAIEACADTWASFPGNSYAQCAHSLASLTSRYDGLLQLARTP
jgi:muramidase (phage lysozyme)